MERLAWIEVVDRHGDVTIRHPVYAWPVKLGRAYTNDIVLDDPYIAANHLEINSMADGRYQLNALGSANGLVTEALRGKRTDATVSANDVTRIGQTQFRIRPIDYVVSAEKLLSGTPWFRSWSALFVGVMVLLLSQLLERWMFYASDDIYTLLLSPLFESISLFLLWAGFWALIGWVQSGRSNFIAHAVIASMCFGLFLLLDGPLLRYVDFALNSNRVNSVLSFLLLPLFLGSAIYRHICLVSRVNRRKLGVTVVVLMVCLVGVINVPGKWIGKNDDLGSMAYLRTIGPPSMLLIHGISIDEFIIGASALKSKVEE